MRDCIAFGKTLDKLAVMQRDDLSEARQAHASRVAEEEKKARMITARVWNETTEEGGMLPATNLREGDSILTSDPESSTDRRTRRREDPEYVYREETLSSHKMPHKPSRYARYESVLLENGSRAFDVISTRFCEPTSGQDRERSSGVCNADGEGDSSDHFADKTGNLSPRPYNRRHLAGVVLDWRCHCCIITKFEKESRTESWL
jgi:hypothetical protein